MFELDEDEKNTMYNWLKKHNKTCKYSNPHVQGAIGGRSSYIFTPTSLGITTKVKCACNEEICLTDYTNW